MSTTDDPGFDAAHLASDPRTDWETLHWIAENRPDLRPEVAANANTYTELLDALAALGDPEVDAALNARADADDRRGPSGGTAYGEGRRAAAADPETVRFHTLMEDPAEEQESWETQTQLPAVSGVEQYTLPAREPEPQPGAADSPADDAASPPAAAAAPPRRAAAARHASGATGQSAAAAMLDQGGTEEEPGRSRLGRMLVMVALPLVAVVAVGAMIWMQISEPDEPVAEAPQDQQNGEQQLGEQEQQTQAPAEEEDETPAAEEALAEARTAVQSLPADTTCSAPNDDAEVVAEYASLAEDADSWTGEDQQLLEATFEDLQEACDTVHAAGVFHDLRGAEGGGATLSGSLDEVGVEWADLAYAEGGADPMESFVTPDGNVHCQWDGTVRCSVSDFDYTPPAGCEDVTTFRLSVDDAGPACDDPVETDGDHEVLDYDETAAIGVLACVSLDDRVSCWNMIDGSGFEVSETGRYTY